MEIYEGLTSVLLGGLYLIWCDTKILMDSVETLILVLIYVFFIKNYVSDYCYSVQAISKGKASLEKLKVSNVSHKINHLFLITNFLSYFQVIN